MNRGKNDICPNLQVSCDLTHMEVSDIQKNLQFLELTFKEVNFWPLSDENVPATPILSDFFEEK